MQSAPPSEKESREQWLLRLMFANIGGILALLGVIVGVGTLLERQSAQGATLTRVEISISDVQSDVSKTKTDIEVIRERVSNQNSRINNLEGRR